MRLSKERLVAFVTMLIYVLSIGLGAVQYLPDQLYAPGMFGNYSINNLEYIALFFIAIFCVYIIPKEIKYPSDWFIIVFNVFLLAPGLTLGIASENLNFEKKTIILPVFVIFMLIISASGKCLNKKKYKIENFSFSKNILYAAIFFWFVLFFMLFINYKDVIKFSGAESIYEQRALTADVGGFWGYLQLYFTFGFSTLLVAYGFNSGIYKYCFIGFFGYFFMYLITAEKSQLMFPLFFIAVNYVLKRKINPLKITSFVVVCFSIIIFGVVFLSDLIKFFDLAGFYLFTRLIVTPSQFILDYYDFFSTNGFTFFSQIRGFNFFVDGPTLYASHPKWPQLGWIVGDGLHGIESNSNATFIASDGVASLGACGVILMGLFFSIYLIFVNRLSSKFPTIFWSIIFSQQAFVLLSGSLFSLLLSFCGLFYLLLMIFYKSNQ